MEPSVASQLDHWGLNLTGLCWLLLPFSLQPLHQVCQLSELTGWSKVKAQPMGTRQLHPRGPQAGRHRCSTNPRSAHCCFNFDQNKRTLKLLGEGLRSPRGFLASVVSQWSLTELNEYSWPNWLCFGGMCL